MISLFSDLQTQDRPHWHRKHRPARSFVGLPTVIPAHAKNTAALRRGGHGRHYNIRIDKGPEDTSDTHDPQLHRSWFEEPVAKGSRQREQSQCDKTAEVGGNEREEEEPPGS